MSNIPGECEHLNGPGAPLTDADWCADCGALGYMGEWQYPSRLMEVATNLINLTAEFGRIRIELCGHIEHADSLRGFTLDKTKYQLRFVEEDEQSIRVLIEPIKHPEQS
jgi:hypothetical protein